MRLRLLFAMVGKDLRRRARSPLPSILFLLFPLLFAGLIALTFGGGEAKMPKVRLLLADEDDSLVGRLVTAAFSRGEAQTYFEVEVLPKTEKVLGDGSALLEAKEAAALLRLPLGLTGDLLAGRPARLELVKNPAQAILPDIAEQVTSVLAEVLSTAPGPTSCRPPSPWRRRPVPPRPRPAPGREGRRPRSRSSSSSCRGSRSTPSSTSRTRACGTSWSRRGRRPCAASSPAPSRPPGSSPARRSRRRRSRRSRSSSSPPWAPGSRPAR